MLKNLKKYISVLFPIIPAAFILLLASCSSTKAPEVQTAETIFNKAMEKFKKEDWEEATQLFDVLKLQYPASAFADDAQFYLAEINYNRSEYILAAFNYNMVRRLYPSSEFVKTSLFKAAMSYYQLSPTFDRDQEYTFKAIDAFQDYQTLYPKDSLYTQAGKYIDELREKLGRRAFSTAELYEKLETSKAVLVYLDIVIEDYSDTKYFEPACFKKVETLYNTKKYDDALNFIEFYSKKFPAGPNLNAVLDYRKIIQSNKK